MTQQMTRYKSPLCIVEIANFFVSRVVTKTKTRLDGKIHNAQSDDDFNLWVSVFLSEETIIDGEIIDRDTVYVKGYLKFSTFNGKISLAINALEVKKAERKQRTTKSDDYNAISEETESQDDNLPF